MAADDDDLRVVDVPGKSRYELLLDGRRIGRADYVHGRDTRVFIHTEVDHADGRHGLGSTLAAGALDDVRAHGWRVRSQCPFISDFLDKHEGYADLVG